ncbi:MAG: hypothetical protein ACJ8F4_05780 [Sphingomonas sp.]
MRVLAIFLAAIASVPATAADRGEAPATPSHPKNAPAGVASIERQCPRTTSYQADQRGLYSGQRLTPRKLTELPPAIGYMAVYRQIGGCEAPMTMAEYRNSRRR